MTLISYNDGDSLFNFNILFPEIRWIRKYSDDSRDYYRGIKILFNSEFIFCYTVRFWSLTIKLLGLGFSIKRQAG